MIVALAVLLLVGCDRGTDLRAELDRYMRQATEVWGFQGAVLVAAADGVLLREGYGAADRETERPITPDTQFMIGSLTKPFTASLILQLAAEKRLDLEAPIATYLPDYPSPGAGEITVHHLLSHSSGIPDLVRAGEFRARLGESHSPGELTAYLRDAPLEFPPGEGSAYSNSNYVLLGMIAEAVTGRTWADLVTERICAPLALRGTGVYPDYPDRSDFAVGYVAVAERPPLPAPYTHPSCGYAAGGLASTVDDLYRLDRALYGTQLLTRESVAAMLAPHAPPHAYGWMLDDPGGHPLAVHGGGLPGYTSILQRWTEDSLCVVILSNLPAVPLHGIALSLSAIVLGEAYEMPSVKEPLPLSPEALAEFAGTYRIAGGGERVLRIEGSDLVSQRDGGVTYRLLPETEERLFFAHDPLTTLTFARDDAGRITGHLLQQVFHRQLAERMP